VRPIGHGLKLVLQLVTQVFPLVDRELHGWRFRAEAIADPLLREQALASIATKRFHCQGGGVYALYPGSDTRAAVRFIVAFQTISDFLDNLCDRAGVSDEAAFRRLHRSLLDAVDSAAAPCDYYQDYPLGGDGGYLDSLVRECQYHLTALPAFDRVAPTVRRYIGLYSDLQSLKHLDPAVREERMLAWGRSKIAAYPEISLWEFGAACGSTLGIFLLLAAAGNDRLSEAEVFAMDWAYFPWIGGLHILLDYYIDAAEDREHADLNFTAYYRDAAECRERLAYFIGQSLRFAADLPHPGFHQTVVHGLLALYLSDPKALAPEIKKATAFLLKRGGRKTRVYQRTCRWLRKAGWV
jgi:tetraprenyl-beta-curcumene synthase